MWINSRTPPLMLVSLTTLGLFSTTWASAPEEPPASQPISMPANYPGPGEPRDDLSLPVPGDLAPEVSLINRDPANWAGIPPDKEWLNFVRDPLKKLDEEYGLLLTGAYTMLFQQSIGPNATSAAAGDLDLVGKWTLLGRGTKDTGSFYMATEYRHDMGNTTPSELGGEIGTLLGTSNSFNDRGWAVKDAYWVQRLFEDHFRFGIGRVDSENLVGNLKLQSSNTSFLNKAFSTNPAIAFPGSGMGAAAVIKPVDWFYFAGGAANAYGVTTQIDIDEVDEWRMFKWIEAGVVPQIEGLGEGKYRVSLWHFDSRSLTNQPSDQGISFLADQQVGENLSLFARYGYSDGDLTKVRQSAQVGGALLGLFGSTADLTGLAGSWSEPNTDGLRDEKVIEVFHRAQLTGRTQFTLGMQLIIDPSNAPDVDALGVFSARLRVTF